VQVSLAPQLRLAGFFISTSGCEYQQIFVRQFVIVLPKPGWIGVEFTGTESRAFLDADVVLQEKCQISGYHQLHNGLPLFNAIELVRACVVVLIEAHVSQLHNRLLSKRAGSWGHATVSQFPASGGTGTVCRPNHENLPKLFLGDVFKN